MDKNIFWVGVIIVLILMGGVDLYFNDFEEFFIKFILVAIGMREALRDN